MTSVQGERSPSTEVQEVAKPVALVTEKASSNDNDTSEDTESNDRAPHLHAKTFLAVFAVCLIYIAQLISLVGAGAVSPFAPSLLISANLHKTHFPTFPLTFLLTSLLPRQPFLGGHHDFPARHPLLPCSTSD